MAPFTNREIRVRQSAALIEDKRTLLAEAFITAWTQASWTETDGVRTKRVERTNLLSHMAHKVEAILRKKKVKGFTSERWKIHTVDVALQCYIDEQKNIPMFEEVVSKRDRVGEDGMFFTTSVIYLNALFSFDKTEKKQEPKGYVPVFKTCKPTGYNNGHKMGEAWDEYAKTVSMFPLKIKQLPKDYWLKQFMTTDEYLAHSERETMTEKYIRAEKAVEYIKSIEDRNIYFSPVPDARSRVAKYRYFFDDGEELDVEHTWMMNWFSRSWRTNMFMSSNAYILNKDGLEALQVAATRHYIKETKGKRTSWNMAHLIFKKESKKILAFCEADEGHGIYYPTIAALIKSGVGTETGFMLESDLTASGIGSAAMNIRSRTIARNTGLEQSTMAIDTHKVIITKLLEKMIHKGRVNKLYNDNASKLKKISTEIAHAQTVKTTVVKLNTLVHALYDGKIEDMTDNVFREVYNEVLPRLLDWIEQATNITRIAANVKNQKQTLYWRANDGVKCATASYTKSRRYYANASTDDGETVRVLMSGDIPMEYCEKGIVYEDELGKRNNKVMGLWANIIQADDAWIKREVTRTMRGEVNTIPMVKHDGYYIHPNHTKEMIAHVYRARKKQLVRQPVKDAMEQLAKDAKYRLELKDGSMTIDDMTLEKPHLGSFMMS